MTQHGSVAPQALGDLRVIELPCLDPMPFFAAAMAAKLFADLGAEVIKIEPLHDGACERRRRPYRGDRPDPETGGLHLYLNTGKLGITLDLAQARARELLFKLLESADIVLNPNPPALNERLGIDWRTLCARFARLIAVSLTHFGAESKYRDLRGGDLIATHMSTVSYDTPVNQVTDPPAQPPLKPAGRQADYLCGLTAASAAMCALFQRKRTGRGQHVDVSQWLAMASMGRPAIGIHSHESADAPYYLRIQTRMKNGLPWVYPCRDGWVSFSPITERFWRGTKNLMGHPEWMENEMFATTISRAAHTDVIEAALNDWLSTQSREEVFAKAQSEHVPCFPVYAPSEVAVSPQYRARGFFTEQNHPVAGDVPMPGAPYKFARTPWRISRPAPRLGEHNRAILIERLGLSSAEFDRLAADGVI